MDLLKRARETMLFVSKNPSRKNFKNAGRELEDMGNSFAAPASVYYNIKKAAWIYSESALMYRFALESKPCMIRSAIWLKKRLKSYRKLKLGVYERVDS